MSEITKPILSIVVPTREGFSEHWLGELLKIKGEVEFILVHPPGASQYPVADPRMRQIISPLRGEVIQRITGLINASGTYILTINCDEYLTPDIAEITCQYFQRFPDMWVMRLYNKSCEFGDRQSLENPWEILVNIDEMKICGRSQGNQKLYGGKDYMREIPLAPLDNKFDMLTIFRGRRDHHGPHLENFDKKVWKTKMVQETLPEILKLIPIVGPFKYVPFWCLDRLLGLFIQAKFFEQGKGKIIGYLLPPPEQLRVEDNPPEYKRTNRYYILAEIFLIRSFPQYGYLWNLMMNHLREIPFAYLRNWKEAIKG
jgi:glycosyltransferase involved in cell wall biosynthesis